MLKHFIIPVFVFCTTSTLSAENVDFSTIVEDLKTQNEKLQALKNYQQTLVLAAKANPSIMTERNFPTELCKDVEYACALIPITTQNYVPQGDQK